MRKWNDTAINSQLQYFLSNSSVKPMFQWSTGIKGKFNKEKMELVQWYFCTYYERNIDICIYI